MIYRRHGIIAGLLIAALSFAIRVVCDVGMSVRDYVAIPIMSFIRASPVAAPLSILPKFKAVAFRVIAALKPVYRESYESNGASLNSSRA